MRRKIETRKRKQSYKKKKLDASTTKYVLFPLFDDEPLARAHTDTGTRKQKFPRDAKQDKIERYHLICDSVGG